MKTMLLFLLIGFYAFTFNSCTKTFRTNPIKLKEGQSIKVKVDGIQHVVKLTEILDGRCPKGAYCFQPDNVSIRIKLDDDEEYTFHYIGETTYELEHLKVGSKNLTLKKIDFGIGDNIGKTKLFTVYLELN